LNLSMADYSSDKWNSHLQFWVFIEFSEANTMGPFFKRSLR
jgi:hypothetical protein